MNEKELNKRMKDISINSRRMILENIGLSKHSKEILIAKYVDELTIDEMCEKFNYEERYIGVKISKAKKELNKIITREYKFMSEDLKEYINLIIEN
jgi:hypothetical protein